MRTFFSSLSSFRRSLTMQPLIAVVGATGTGKSKLAVDLALRFNGEIINGDAMQMYRGLPIITNQIPVEERNGIPHHLLSCIDLEEEPWRVGMFRKECLRIIDDIHARGKLPILVGGTHYYTQAVLFKDQLVREEDAEGDEDADSSVLEDADSSEKWPILDAEPEVVLNKLREVDPVMAARWHPNDTRKIRRSLEIFFQTGKPASQVYAEQKNLKQAALSEEDSVSSPELLRFPTIIFWVHSEKGTLNDRLNNRVDDMIDQGLLSEASRMLEYIQKKEAQGVTVDQTRGVWVSIGFKELSSYFEALRNGSLTEAELTALKELRIESIKTATRQYAGSQIKWIRIKLWGALAEAGMTKRLYLLDSTDVSRWTRHVTEPSEQIVEAFLRGAPVPDPKSLSELARNTIGAREAQLDSQSTNQNPVVKCIVCDVCRKTMANEEQYQIHINGYAHRRVVKAAAKRRERDEYLRKKRESLENAQAIGHGNADELDSKELSP